MDAPTIRPAAPGDVAELSALAQRTWADAFGDGVSAEDEAIELGEGRSEAYFSGALREKTILVAEEAGVLLGYVQFGAVDIPEVAARTGDRELHRLYVETALQGRGVGRRLLEAALAHPRLAGAERVFLRVWERNERAVRLYESVGFERCGTTAFTVGNEPMEDLVLVLDRSRAQRTGSSRSIFLVVAAVELELWARRIAVGALAQSLPRRSDQLVDRGRLAAEPDARVAAARQHAWLEAECRRLVALPQLDADAVLAVLDGAVGAAAAVRRSITATSSRSTTVAESGSDTVRRDGSTARATARLRGSRCAPSRRPGRRGGPRSS